MLSLRDESAASHNVTEGDGIDISIDPRTNVTLIKDLEIVNESRY
jgi:hypothetical protein